MGSGTLNDRTNGQTIDQTFFNDIHSALNGDFVGRNSSGVATSGQNLGTVATPWGTIHANGLVLDGTSIDGSTIVSPANRIISGKLRSTSDQPMFIKPNGAAASFLLEGASTNLLVDINGSVVTVSTDITKSSLTVAPGSNNTCLVNDAAAANQDDTRYWGESNHAKPLTVDNMGSNITALVGQFAAFKTGTEYFLAYVESATQLNRAYRGYFYDSSYGPLNRVKLTDNDVITLMSLGWVFIENNATTVDVTYTNPVWAQTAPSSPTTGDYWYDLDNSVWKRYDGASFQIINRTLIGIVVIDATNCVAARSFDFFGQFSSNNTIELKQTSTSVVAANALWQSCNVYGRNVVVNTLTNWNITTDLATSADLHTASEQASTDYYFYLANDGTKKISDIAPHWRPDLLGFYHPHNPWRCVGGVNNDGSSNFDETTLSSYGMDHLWRETVHISDQKAANTAGGTFTSGSYVTRTLNTINRKTGVKWAHLASDRIHLAAGSYDVWASAPGGACARHKAKIQNITDASVAALGTAQNSDPGGGQDFTISEVRTILTLSTPKSFELQHQCTTTAATSGLGLAVNIGDTEIYSQVRITKIR